MCLLLGSVIVNFCSNGHNYIMKMCYNEDVMRNQDITGINHGNNQKNRIGVLAGLVFCIILVVCSIVMEIVVIHDEALRAMGKHSGWNGNGFIVIFEILPMLIIASIVSHSCGKKAVGVAKTILDYLRPAFILIGGLLVVPILGIIIVSLLAGK